MKFDLSQPGLYYLLNTPEVQAELRRLKLDDKAAFEKKPDTDLIARMMARAISDEVEKFIADKLKEESAKATRSENWVHDAIHGLPDAIELRSAAEKTIPADEPISRQILKEIKLLGQADDTERPTTELTESELIVPNGRSPQLGNEIERELKSSERADWLVSFIKLKAIRAFYPQLQQFCGKTNADGSPRLRIATTTYMGATDVEALKLLFALPNTEVKVCFNTSQTRLHAKAYVFHRKTAFGSAYIGSANLSSQALTSGLEWTVKIAQQEIPHLWQRAIVEFDSCWNDENFERCTSADLERIRDALSDNRVSVTSCKRQVSDENLRSYVTIHPHSYQKKMVDELAAERALGKHRHLIASATGTGKTIAANKTTSCAIATLDGDLYVTDSTLAAKASKAYSSVGAAIGNQDDEDEKAVIRIRNSSVTLSGETTSTITDIELSFEDDNYNVLVDTKTDGKTAAKYKGDKEVYYYKYYSVSAGHTCYVKNMGITDVPDKSWYHEAVDYVLGEGMMKGTSATTFEPNGIVTRAQFAQILYNMEGNPAIKSKNVFTDVKEGKWYYNAVIWAYENGITSGTSKTTFTPDGQISRQEMATLLYRYAKYKGYKVLNTETLSAYPDKDSVGKYYVDSMKWAVANGIITGKSANGTTTLSPDAKATRSEVATIFMRFDKIYG